jgi:hypothetical protein
MGNTTSKKSSKEDETNINDMWLRFGATSHLDYIGGK